MLYSWHKIGERIRQCRNEMGITQQQLAYRIEDITGKTIKRQTVARWENGKPICKLEQLAALCHIFDCEMGYLLCEDGYNLKTRAKTDIENETGLTENTIKNILEIKNEGCQNLINKLLEDLTDYQLLPALATSYARYKSKSKGDYYIFDENQKLITLMQGVPLLVLQNDFTMFLQSGNEYSKEAFRRESHKWTEEEKAEYLAEIQSDIQRGK